MNEQLKQLIADARIALENIESHPSNIYRNAGKEHYAPKSHENRLHPPNPRQAARQHHH
jgi:hypothetical protein